MATAAATVPVGHKPSARYLDYQSVSYGSSMMPTSIPDDVSTFSSSSTVSASSSDPRDKWPSSFNNTSPEVIVLSSDEEDAYTVRRPRRRKRTKVNEEEVGLVVTGKKQRRGSFNFLQQNYVPPRKPISKPGEIRIPVIEDFTTSGIIDETDGHYIIKDNEVFAGGRYRVEKLLGQGTFGRVVRAQDMQTKKHYAVKVIKSVAKYREASKIELRVLTALMKYDKQNFYSCVRLREAFDWKNHICLVTELLDISIFDFMKMNSFIGFPISQVQQIAYQLFLSVSFLHDLNLIHTDLKPENILLKDQSHSEVPYRPAKRSSKTQCQRKVLLDTKVNLVDFGSAVFADEYHSSVVSTRHYRAPEIILGIGWSFPCDIWSIGCILVELWTGDALFQTHDNLEHLALIEKIFERRIDRMLILRALQNSTGSKLIDRSNLRIDFPGPKCKANSDSYVSSMKCISKLISAVPGYSRAKSKSKFWSLFLDLLSQIFVCDPAQRITAKDALNHPWFQESYQDCAQSV